MNQAFDPKPPLPDYLTDYYQWAYTTSRAVKFWDRPWLVNLILWGNYRRLSNAALQHIEGNCLQIAAVYGDLSKRISEKLAPNHSLTVVDIAPVQLANLARKCPHINLHCQNSSRLQFADDSFDTSLLFFLLHEQPADVRQKTISEALRVTHPGGKVIIVDYHKPKWWHPLRWVMAGAFKWLEPFAGEFWDRPLARHLTNNAKIKVQETFFSELYELTIIEN
ncbi:rhodoquinone biosynthesis methyltransferase RquA [Porticoccus sp. W117]|uniref:rhodoquinone biosynthesis methyltransferase RquA n=1 Tax=Porticoccus sp. W117 TaxID=3054777 RepID=UPI00259696BE|nr:rhodoquinone biosynthesis methyltransferase RquA [Porticoccus sp. W117]MDM3870930.1 rhodoquinone biosynthesis methyltransferase RquA [Porticoccus sp. W117]